MFIFLYYLEDLHFQIGLTINMVFFLYSIYLDEFKARDQFLYQIKNKCINQNLEQIIKNIRKPCCMLEYNSK